MDFSAVPSNELAQLCSHAGSNEAWAEFVRRFQRPVALAVMRTARGWGVKTPDMLDDLVQETFLRLCADGCRLLRSFVPREPDSIVGYLTVIANNVTHDQLRGEKTWKRGGHMTRYDKDGEGMDSFLASLEGEKTIDRHLQKEEIDRTLRALIPHKILERDRTIFWLYFEQGMSAPEIGRIKSLELKVKGVESSIRRTSKEVRRLLMQAQEDG